MASFTSNALLYGRLMRHAASSGANGSAMSRAFMSTQAANVDERKVALVLGSSGVLGSTVSHYLSRELNMNTIGADIVELPNEFNESDWELDGFITLPKYSKYLTFSEVTTVLASGVNQILGETAELDTIVCASGGWRGDPEPATGKVSIAEEIEQGAREYGDVIDQMLYMNLMPVTAAGYTAQRFMGANGLFVVIGATPALSATPGMMGYGLAKAATHHLVQTLGATTGKSMEKKSKRKEGRRLRQHAESLDTLSVVGILPTTIDTPSNRNGMPDADFTKWTKPRDIAAEICKWARSPPLRPHSGSLVKVSSSEKGSTFELVR